MGRTVSKRLYLSKAPLQAGTGAHIRAAERENHRIGGVNGFQTGTNLSRARKIKGTPKLKRKKASQPYSRMTCSCMWKILQDLREYIRTDRRQVCPKAVKMPTSCITIPEFKSLLLIPGS